MPPREIHVIGVDPGATTGWARLTIPRKSMFGDEDPEIVSWHTGELRGPESQQAWEMCRIIREVQSLAFKIGPAVVVEDFDFGSPLRDPAVYSPVRIGAMLTLLHERTALMNDARLIFQSRTLAKETMTDERLRALGLYEERVGDHRRDAMRHALTALRRARQKPAFRDRMWDPKYAIA